MEDCIFCKIIKGEIPSYKVYEDDFVYAFLDANPLVEGHTLVIPKKHQKDIFEVDDFSKIMSAVKIITQKMRSNFNCQGINVFNSNGAIAGQTVFHFHIHLIPRKEGDGLNLFNGGDLKLEKSDFERVLSQLKIEE